jgi:tetratricopeptide (TPR) repeat protein
METKPPATGGTAAAENREPDTIVPVTPGFRRGGVERPRRQRPQLATRLAGLVVASALAVAAWAVFVWLPARLAPPPAQLEPVAETVEAPGTPAAPVLTEEELADLRSQTERLLSQLLRQQTRVLDRAPAEWAGDDWSRYQSLSRAGDDAYLADAYWDAVPAYREALELGERVLASAEARIESALGAGRNALAEGDHVTATREFQTVLIIDRDNRSARDGLARAQQLPDLLAAIARAEALRDEGRLAPAAEAYREALRIDPAWAPARTALADVSARIERARFEGLMSQGYAALAEEDWNTAEARFNDALAMRPDAPEARDGLTQAEQGRTLDQIALAEARALAFERREMWNEAIAQYRAALVTDPTLAFARQGIDRSEPRADLDLKLVNLIENPTLLMNDQVLSDAYGLLAEANGYDSPAGRLSAQTDALARLIEVAATPIAVELVSDQQTEVTLYRVGTLGRFASRTVELRPGTYTAVGSRHGFRDVRRTFTVLPGQTVAPVTVACVEPI